MEVAFHTTMFVIRTKIARRVLMKQCAHRVLICRCRRRRRCCRRRACLVWMCCIAPLDLLSSIRVPSASTYAARESQETVGRCGRRGDHGARRSARRTAGRGRHDHAGNGETCVETVRW